MKRPHKHSDSTDLVFLPLGGIGEIGMNCYVYGLGNERQREWLMVDLGVRFGTEKEPGVDVILPDVGFITKNRKDLAGLVITHAHEDHIGAIAWLWPQLECDIHCTPFAAELIKLKLREHGHEEAANLVVHPPGARFTVGSFNLEYLSITHSIPESCSLLIECEAGRVVHSGDWKIDRTPVLGLPFKEDRFREIGDKGVDAFICDSTNVLREGVSPSERDVATTLAHIIGEAKGRVAITTFASHVERIVSAVRAARQNGREVAVVGRAMRNTIEAARICGMIQDMGQLLNEDEFGYLPADRVMLLCTGSQGEPRAAIARIAEDSHPHVALEQGDLVIFSARTIPGNEKEVSAIHNNLAALGVDIITTDDALVHSSGHPRQGELKLLYELLRPKAVIPMHGEMRHLRRHVKFARECGVPHAQMVGDGKIARLAPGPIEEVDEASSGSLHVDGKLIVASENGPARERRKLSFAGAVFASVVVAENGQLDDDIRIETEGVPEGIIEELEIAAEKAFDSMPKARRKDDATVEETLRTAIRRTADQIWGKKPVCKVVLVRV